MPRIKCLCSFPTSESKALARISETRSRQNHASACERSSLSPVVHPALSAAARLSQVFRRKASSSPARGSFHAQLPQSPGERARRRRRRPVALPCRCTATSHSGFWEDMLDLYQWGIGPLGSLQGSHACFQLTLSDRWTEVADSYLVVATIDESVRLDFARSNRYNNLRKDHSHVTPTKDPTT